MFRLCFTLFCYFRIIYWPRDERKAPERTLKCTRHLRGGGWSVQGMGRGRGSRANV